MEKEGEISFGDEKLKEAFEELSQKDKDLSEQLEKAFEEISKKCFLRQKCKERIDSENTYPKIRDK